MNFGIDQLVPSCATRQEHHYKLMKAVLVNTELQWKKAERNIFHCQGKDNLLGIDYLSNDPKTPGAVKSQWKATFSRQDIPLTLGFGQSASSIKWPPSSLSTDKPKGRKDYKRRQWIAIVSHLVLMAYGDRRHQRMVWSWITGQMSRGTKRQRNPGSMPWAVM